MPHDYDRTTTAGVNFNQMVGKPAEADEALTKAYQALVNFKLGMDAMHEIPATLKPYYQQVMKAMDVVIKAQKESYQLRMMMRKLPL